VQGAIAGLSPTSLNFGEQTAGIKSTPQSATLTNSGNVALAITAIGITGSSSRDFTQINNCGPSVSVSGGCNIQVTITPAATGTRDAAVSITDNASGGPQSVSLTGVGVLPGVAFSPSSLTFPNQVVFSTSPGQQAMLKNSGAGVLTIPGISVTGPFSQSNNCLSSTQPSTNCTISVKFHPATNGVIRGKIIVTDNATGSPQPSPLRGTGTSMLATPTTANCGMQPVCIKSLPKTITLTNKGDSAVKISSIVITGTNSGDFAETNTCGAIVASGASCFIKVTFKPLAKGMRTANVSIKDNGGWSPQNISLTGTGT
jgi:hypothetical protein